MPVVSPLFRIVDMDQHQGGPASTDTNRRATLGGRSARTDTPCDTDALADRIVIPRGFLEL